MKIKSSTHTLALQRTIPVGRVPMRPLQWLLLGVALTFCPAYPASAQGPLTPPGAPTPAMKTLVQVEPRISIGSLPFVISNAGSYYLETNLTGLNGVTIQANNVTLDLRGFALIGPEVASGDGITVSGNRRNIVIENGTVTGWGGDGVDARDAGRCQIRRVRASFNNGHGIRVGSESLVTGCTSETNGANGILAAFCCMVSQCVASANSTNGIGVGNGSLVSDCVSAFNNGDGIHTEQVAVTIRNCNTSFNGDDGIHVEGSAVVEGNHCHGNGTLGFGAGIYTGANNRIVDNNVIGNDWGLRVTQGGNFIVRNTASDNDTLGNYSITGTQTIGPIETATGTITNLNPWANFEF